MRQATGNEKPGRRSAPGGATTIMTGATPAPRSTRIDSIEIEPAQADSRRAGSTRMKPQPGTIQRGSGRRASILAIWLPLLLAGLLLGACDSQGSHDSPNGSMTLSGVVTDDPLVNAAVVVYGPNSEILGIDWTDEAGEYFIPAAYVPGCRVVANGGTIAGLPFTGTMESICDGTPTCHVTPLTTLAAALVDDHGLSLGQARREVARTCGVSPGEDPFVREHQGLADEADLAWLAQMRESLDGGADIDTWVAQMTEILPQPFDGPLRGTAESNGFLGGAQVTVIDNNGNFIEAITDDEGNWQTPLNLTINTAFRVKSEGGSSLAADFDGTLSAYVPYDENIDLAETPVDESIDLAKTPLRLTILSTLIDRYMQYSGRSYDDARQAVKTYLRIPEDVGLDDDTIGMYFSNLDFMSLCDQNGGFDAFVDALVARIDSGESRSFNAASNSYEIVKVPFSGKILNGVIGGAGSAGVGFALNGLVTLLGPTVGYQTPEQITAQHFAEIQNTLSTMSTQLNGLENQLTTLTSNLDMATDEIISHVYSAAANSAAARIKTRLAEYASLAGPQALPVFFADMANGASELKNDLTEIDTSLFQPAIGTGSGLEYLVSSLEEKVRVAAYGDEKNRVLYESYKTLETIYTQAMAVQIQGTALLKSKFDYEDGGDLARSESYLNGILRPRFVNQTQKFLIYVERLVAASADTRTFVTGGGAMFPSCTASVFHEADLLAREFIEDHDYGFVVHIAGDPKSMAQFYSSPQERDWGPACFVPIGGSDTRDYAAPLAQDATYYLGWTLDRNTRWHFSQETKVRFAKLRFAEVESRLADIKPHTGTYRFPYDQTAQIKFERIMPADIPYAHGFVTARAVPAFNFKNENIVDQNDYYSYPVSLEHKADLPGAALTARYGRGRRCDGLMVSTRANIYLEIINDSPAAADLRLSGAVAESVTNDTGGKTPCTSQELQWKVAVGGNRMFGHNYEYSVPGTPWHHLRTSHKHTHTDDNGGTARWLAGGTLAQMRQVYFRVDRASTQMTCAGDLAHVDTVFKATLKKLEIKPAD